MWYQFLISVKVHALNAINLRENVSCTSQRANAYVVFCITKIVFHTNHGRDSEVTFRQRATTKGNGKDQMK